MKNLTSRRCSYTHTVSGPHSESLRRCSRYCDLKTRSEPTLNVYSQDRGFVLPPSKIVLFYPLLGATLRLRRWPPPLGPPTETMPGHLSPECGLITRNDTHLRDDQSRRSSSLGELGISIVRAARPSTPELLLAWCRSLAGRQPLGLGEDVRHVGGSTQRAQQLGGLQGHGTNYQRRAVAIRCMERKIGATSLRGCCTAAAWCGGFQWS